MESVPTLGCDAREAGLDLDVELLPTGAAPALDAMKERASAPVLKGVT
jgi:hypothetical protein